MSVIEVTGLSVTLETKAISSSLKMPERLRPDAIYRFIPEPVYTRAGKF